MSRYSPQTTDRAAHALPLTTPDDIDGLFRALAHPTRRRILRHLVQADTPQSSDQLVPVFTTTPTAASSTPGTPRQKITLTHKHLPLLCAAGLIERTTDDHIRPSSRAHEAVRVLDAVAGHE